jgi:hypothetical protein
MTEWSSTYLCSICNASRNIVKVLEDGTDNETGNPYQKMEMECGHVQKRLRVSKSWQINKNEKVRVEPVISDGRPSVAVSGGSQTTIVGGPVNIGIEGKDNKIVVNITNIQSEGNSNFAQDISDINTTYNEILKEIDRNITNEAERQEIKPILEEIKNDLKSKRIPQSGLDKLKAFEKIYYMVYPLIMKIYDIINRTGAF